jgi:hypothetical protein
MILQALLDQRDQRMGFNIRREWERLRVRIPRALQRDSSIAVTWIGLDRDQMIENWKSRGEAGRIMTNPILGGIWQDSISSAGCAHA